MADDGTTMSPRFKALDPEKAIFVDRNGHAYQVTSFVAEDLGIIGGGSFSSELQPPSEAKVSSETRPPTPQTDPVEVVWSYYVEVMGASRQTLNATRRRIVAAALKVRSIDLCKRAIDGLRISPYHNGENEQRQKYLDVRYALRGNGQRGESNEERIDKMAAFAPTQPGHPSASDATIARLIDEVRYTVETGGERERGKKARARLVEMGFSLTRLTTAPWVRVER